MVARGDCRVVHLSSIHTHYAGRILDKECRALVEAGFEVRYVAPDAPDELRGGVRLVGRFPKIRTRPLRWIRVLPRLFEIAAAQKADLFHAHDPELLPILMQLKRLGARVVYDAHEILPVKLETNRLLGPKLLRPYVAPWVAKLEQAFGNRCDGVVGAIEEITASFGDVPKATVCNYVRYGDIADATPVERKTDRFVLIYAGGLSRERGIREIVDAVGCLDGAAELWLLGPWVTAGLQQECEQLSGWRYTTYFGKVEPAAVRGYLRAADAGLHLVHRIPAYSSGKPMKAFEYMAAGLPFVITDDAAKRNTFGEFALFADPHDPDSVVAQIQTLIDQPELRKSLAQKGTDTVRALYSWESQAQKLIALYDRLLNIA